MDDALRNHALHLAQEWGEHWLEPIQTRLGTAYPDLTPPELDHYNALAQEAMKAGYDLVYSMAKAYGATLDPQRWQVAYTARFPWVNQENLARLFSIGRYYAWKDGVG